VGIESLELFGTLTSRQYNLDSRIFQAGLESRRGVHCVKRNSGTTCLEDRKHGHNRENTLVKASGNEKFGPNA
jgi:hypothetical protein